MFMYWKAYFMRVVSNLFFNVIYWKAYFMRVVSNLFVNVYVLES